MTGPAFRVASTYLETSERRVNLPLAPPAGVRALTTKGPSAAATNRHACNPCPPSFCQPASRNGRSGDSQGVLATASVAVSSARGPSSVRFPHARGRELGTGIESSPLAPLGGTSARGPSVRFPHARGREWATIPVWAPTDHFPPHQTRPKVRRPFLLKPRKAREPPASAGRNSPG